jgi:adenine-specific DNA-methyltransferase
MGSLRGQNIEDVAGEIAKEYIPEFSHGDSEALNAIYQGDNLDVLTHIAPAYQGKVKCIYIDPPYNNHEYVLVYAKSAEFFKKSRNYLDINADVLSRYKNPDNDHRGSWQSVSATAQAGHAVASQFYEIIAPNGRRHVPPKGRCWIYNESQMLDEIQKGNIWFGAKGNGVPRIKKFLSERKIGLTPETLWTAEDVGTTDIAKKHLLQILRDQDVFDTPKPESLLKRILTIATNPDDLVLDAYLGSGTTAAVAQKMGRQFIGIELGNHAITHCVERLRLVINGEQGGISEEVKWMGGGGFNFYRQL